MPLVRAYGRHLHTLVQLRSARQQSTGTFFMRNRPELELLVRLLCHKSGAAPVSLTVLGCSKGAEVYSISYALRSAYPDLKVNIQALDISLDVVEFAKRGIYSLRHQDDLPNSAPGLPSQELDLLTATQKDQISSIFERMTLSEKEAMFDIAGKVAKVKRHFRDGITWKVGDANDPCLVGTLGLQGVVVANRFLCHMQKGEAEKCLRNIAHLVKSGGYLFVSGVDLDVRTKVASECGWEPITELIHDIHDGDTSLREGWPLNYWGLEPFGEGRLDSDIRYASVFKIGGEP